MFTESHNVIDTLFDAQEYNSSASFTGDASVAAVETAANTATQATGAVTKAEAELHKKLRAMAQKAVTKTKVTGLSLDPVLGSDNTLISLGAKLQRQHGMALPVALTAVLTFHGLKVIREAPIPLMLTACRMASCNDIDALRKVNMPETDTIKEIYRADLVVIDPVSGYIGAFDCKRGTGNSDSSSKAHLEKKLKASLSSLHSWAMSAHKFGSLTEDVRVIDLYAQSGYADSLKINGCDLDHYFGYEIIRHMAVFNKEFSACSMAVRKASGSRSAGENAELSKHDADDFGFPMPEEAIQADLMDYDSEININEPALRIANFQFSPAVARQKFIAAKAH
ncbi:hypothetical protein [Ahrensia sp. 13_GOM-1096m]|uniref:hypothetical protein n=1 Tax=Ahrensia sp. 13_GOM-1096m TaxID=1380380 RepID=UPI00047AA2B8|nr:hypothetical protein [Ahrensia sp. 13_GOM-1096m]